MKNKLLIISDLHSFSNDEKFWVRASVETGVKGVVSLGDVRREYLEWLRSWYDGPIYFIYGNHDNYGDYDGIPNIVNLHGSRVNISGVMIGGVEGSPIYNGREVEHTEGEIKEALDRLGRVDILFSHAGAKYGEDDFVHDGFTEIWKYTKVNKPRYSISGHRHQNMVLGLNGVTHISVFKVGLLDLETGVYRQII